MLKCQYQRNNNRSNHPNNWKNVKNCFFRINNYNIISIENLLHAGCIFCAEFGCCTLQTLVKICFLCFSNWKLLTRIKIEAKWGQFKCWLRVLFAVKSHISPVKTFFKTQKDKPSIWVKPKNTCLAYFCKIIWVLKIFDTCLMTINFGIQIVLLKVCTSNVAPQLKLL